MSLRPEAKAPAVLAVVGFVNVPIVKFSVDLWSSLHQPASILKLSGPSIHMSMLKPLFTMIIACFFYYLWIVSVKIENSIIEQKISRLQKGNY